MPEDASLSMSEAASAAEAELTGESEQAPAVAEPSDSGAEGDKQTSPPTQSVPSLDPIAELEKLQLDATLKEELKKGYLRQSDYTKKTQEIASIRKQAEEYNKVLPIVNRVFNDPVLTRAVMGIDPLAQQQQEEIPDDPKAYAEWVINQSVEKMRTEMEAREQERQVEMARDYDINEAEKVDPRLQDESFAKLVAGMVAMDEGFISGNTSAVEATKAAIQMVDTYITQAKSQAKNDLFRRASEKRTLQAPRTSPANTSTGDAKTMREAAELALAELTD